MVLSAISAALADTPVVLLVGARRTGKTTLAQGLVGEPGPLTRYVTLDDATEAAAAARDPMGFVDGLTQPVVIDEIQKAPELLPAIKMAVDRQGAPGRFLLTGSADVLALPRVSESLAGRIEIITVWPLSQSEIEGTSVGLIDIAFSSNPSFEVRGSSQADVVKRAVTGGYPEAVRRTADRRAPWFRSYVTTLIQRDIRDLAQIEGLREIPNLLGLIAARNTGSLNYSALASDTALSRPTIQRYFSLFEAVFLVRTIPAWASNLGTRLVKSPKILMVDTGLAASLSGLTEPYVARDPNLAGRLVEGFALMELRKLADVSSTHPTLYHLRTHGGIEVDAVMEAPDGRLVGVEVKAAASVGSSDFNGLRFLQERLGDRFHLGMVLYAGRETVKFSSKLWAIPLAALWMPEHQARPVERRI